MLSLHKIVCPVDFSEPSLLALTRASELAARFAAELHVLHVVPFSPQLPADLVIIAVSSFGTDQERKEEALRQLDEVIAQRVKFPIQVQPVVKMGHAAHEIACFAEDEGCDLIVLATQGHGGWRQFVFGSVAENVLHMAPCPVLTLRPLLTSDEQPQVSGLKVKDSLLPFQTILCPVDYSDSSLVALDVAKEWTKFFSSRLDVLHMTPTISQELAPGEYAEPEYNRIWLDTDRKKLYDIVAKRLPFDIDAHALVRLGGAATGIERAARDEHADLIVLATHGYSGWKHLVLGSVTEHLLRATHCPLLIIRTTNNSKAPSAKRSFRMHHTSEV